jgi:formylmethanofuran dehydrogenase subunit C
MLRLTWKGATSAPVEADVLSPDRLEGLSAAEVLRLPVLHGNRREALGEFADAEGICDDGRIVLSGDWKRVKWIGARMTQGEILIEGDAGMHLGAEMRGGRIRVRGSAEDWAGAEMRGGLIQIDGNAGHLVGAAYRGSSRGMRGGTIIVVGNAGHEVGSTMRRGLIVILGSVGDFCGAAMIAGTILSASAVGERPGAGMKRGSLILVGPALGAERPALLPTFRYAGSYRPVFLRLLASHLSLLDLPGRFLEPLFGCFGRYSGDLVEKGLGEIFLWERN